jgi:hypothetical protein
LATHLKVKFRMIPQRFMNQTLTALFACLALPVSGARAELYVAFANTASPVLNRAMSSVGWTAYRSASANDYTNIIPGSSERIGISNVTGNPGSDGLGYFFCVNQTVPHQHWATVTTIGAFNAERFTWRQGNGTPEIEVRIMIRQGENWYATNQSFTNDFNYTLATFQMAEAGEVEQTFEFTTGATAWRTVTLVPGAELTLSETTLDAALPSNTITGIGLFIQHGPTTGTTARIDTLTVEGEYKNNYPAWIAGFDVGNLVSPTDDPDGDGIQNAVENYFGTSPLASDPGIIPVDAAGNIFTFVHPLSPDFASDLAADYEWSLNLSDWIASGETGEDVTVDITAAPEGDTAAVTAMVTAGTASKLFVRVKVTQSPATGGTEPFGDPAIPASIPGLVAFWDFAEPADETRVSRGTAHAHPLTVAGPQVERVPGGPYSGWSARLNGSNYLYIPYQDTADLNISGPDAEVSMFAVVQVFDLQKSRTIAGMWSEGLGANDDSGTRQYAMLLNMPTYGGPNRLVPHISSEGGVTRRADGTAFPWCADYAVSRDPVPTGVWVTLAFTYDSQHLSAYINGELAPHPLDPVVHQRNDRYFLTEGPGGADRGINPYYHGRGIFTYDPVTHAASKPRGGSDFIIGARFAGGTFNHEGSFSILTLGGLAVYDRALSAAEIAELHESANLP